MVIVQWQLIENRQIFFDLLVIRSSYLEDVTPTSWMLVSCDLSDTSFLIVVLDPSPIQIVRFSKIKKFVNIWILVLLVTWTWMQVDQYQEKNQSPMEEVVSCMEDALHRQTAHQGNELLSWSHIKIEKHICIRY